MALRDKRWAAPLFLAVASPVLAEVLSGNLPPGPFLAALWFLLIAYGIPVLLIRDAWVRLRLGVPGLFVLGLAYGLVNEALFAKTVFMDVHVPVPNFDGYASSGVNWAWASFIVPWHALHSVLYPIAFAWWLFPERRSEPWLSRRASVIGFVVVMVLGAVVHAGHENVQGSVSSWLLSVVLIGALTLLALRLPKTPTWLEPGPCKRGITWIGVLVAPFLFLMAGTASAHLPTLTLVATSATFFAVLFLVLWRRGGFHAPAFLRFALGNELSFVVLSIAFDAQRGAFDSLVAHIVLEMVFILGLIRLRRQDMADAEGPPPPPPVESSPTTPVQSP